MGLGNLSVKVSADIGNFTANMDLAGRVAQERMAASSAALDNFRQGMLQSGTDTKQAADQMASSMVAANDAITKASKQAADSITSIQTTADNADFRTLGEKISEAIGTGIGVGIVAANKAWDGFVEYSKAKALVIGVAVSAVFAAAGLGAIYAGYKVISGSLDFITGLITGSSYKSDNIDALITANNQVKEIQKSLGMTAQQAAITNEAIAALGMDKGAYIAVFNDAQEAMRSNTDALDELGVKYGSVDELIQSAASKLNEYTEGWDRNQVATQLGLGTAEQVAAAAELTGKKFAEAGNRLADYNLGIGQESQKAAKAYTDTMREFNHNMDLMSQGFKRAIADNIMPVLTDLADFFKDGFPSVVNVFRYSMATVTSLFYGLKTSVYIAAESIVGSLSAIGIAIASAATAAAYAVAGDFTKAKNELVTGWESAQNRINDIGKNIAAQAQHNANAMRMAWAMDDRADPGKAAEQGKSAPDFKAAKQAKEQAEAYDQLKQSITEKINAQNLEISVNDKLTESQRMMNQFVSQLAAGKSDLNDAQKAEYAALLETLNAREKTARAMDEARKQAAKTQAEAVSDYDKLMKSIKEKDAAQQLEMQSGRALTEVEKMRTKALADMDAKLFKFSDTSKKSVEVQKAELETGMKKLAADEKAIAYARQAAAEHAKYIESLGAGVERLREQVAQQQEYNDRLGLTKSAIAALDTAQLENQATSKESIADTMDLMDWSGKLGDAYREQAKALRELAKAKRDGGAKEDAIEAKKALDAQAANYEAAYQASNKKIGDGLYREIGNGTQSALKKLAKDVKELFARLVLQPIISPISNFAASVINPNAPSAQGSAGGGLGMIGNGLSAYNSLSSLGMSAGSGLLAAGNFLGSSTLASAGYAAAVPGLTSFGAGSQAAMLAAQTAEFGAAGLASTASAGAGAAGAGGGGLLSGASSALGAIPVVGWIALAAAAAAYFGRGKDRELTGVGLSGSLGTQNITRDVSWTKDGGWFNSDTAGTWKYNLGNSSTTVDGRNYTDTASQKSDQALLKTITDQYDAMKKAATDYAKSLGLDASYLAARTQDFSITLGTTAEEMQKNIGELFKNVGNDISKELLNLTPGLEKLAKDGESSADTLSRLATDIRGVNDTMILLGSTTYKLDAAGIGAAENLVKLYGGLQSLQSISASYYDKYYSDSEKAKLAISSVTSEFQKAGTVLPTSMAQLREWIEAAKELGTEAGDKTYVSLMQLTGAFASLTEATSSLNDAASKKANDLAAAKSDLTLQTMQAQGLGLQALNLKRQTEIMLMDEELRPYAEKLDLALKEKDARELANRQASLAVQILELQGKTAEAAALKHKLEMQATEDGLKPQTERIYQLQLETAAMEVAKQHRALDIELMRALGNEEGALAAERADALKGLDEYSKAVKQQTWAANDAKAAIEKAKASAEAEAQRQQKEQQEQQAAHEAAQQAYNQRLNAAKNALQTAYNTEANALQNIISKMQSFATAARAMQQTLLSSPTSPISTDDQYALIKAQLPDIMSDAKAGNQGAIEKLQQFVALSQQSSTNFIDYMRDFATAQNALDDAAASAERQVRQNQSQLDYLKSQVDALLEVDKSVLSVADAIKALQDVMAGGLGMVTDAVNGQNAAKAAEDAAKKAAAKTASSKYGFVGGADYGKDSISTAYTAPSSGENYDRYAKFMALATGWAKEHYDTSAGYAQSVTTDVANMLMQLADSKGISLDRALEGGLDYAKQAYTRQYGQQTKVFSSADLTGNGLVKLAAAVEKQDVMLNKIAINTGNAASAASKTADVFTNGPMLVEFS